MCKENDYYDKKYSEYCCKIQEFGLSTSNNSVVDIDSFLKMKQNIRTVMLPLFDNITVSALGIKKLPPFNFENIINGIVYNVNNLSKKAVDKNFYQQNSLAFIHTINNILKMTDSGNISEVCVQEHICLLKELFFQSCVFIQRLFCFRKIVHKARKELTLHNPIFMMNDELHKILHGKHYPLSNKKLCIFPAIPVLRIMIEVKIKYALGIIGLKNKQNDSIEPIALSKVFSVLSDYVKDGYVIFSVDYSCLKKIYSWTNIYIHSGFRVYIWYPFIFEEYLRPFFNGGNVDLGNGCWNIKAGIRIKRKALNEIRNDINPYFELECFDDENALEAVLID